MQIHNNVVQTQGLTECCTGCRPAPGDTVYSFTVRDPYNRYLPVPWQNADTDTRSPWIETIPLCLDVSACVRCVADNLESYRKYFQDLGCSLTATQQYIQPKPTYRIDCTCDGATDLLAQLVHDDEKYALGTCTWQAQRLADPEAPRLVNGWYVDNIPRTFDAYCDFQNVRAVVVCGTEYLPEIFIREHPLIVVSTKQTSLIPEDPDQPILMSGMVFDAAIRRALLDIY